MCSQTRFTDERTNLGTEERNSGLTTEAERQDDTPGTSPQSVAAMTGTNLEADIANAAAVVNGPVGCKITNNQDTEQPLRQNIQELDKTLEQHCREAFANVEDTCNIRGQMKGLKKEVGSHRAELSRLEGEVLPQLMAQRDEVKYQLQKHSNNTKDKVDGIPALAEKLKNLSEKLEQYHKDVSFVREEVSKLSRVISKLETDFRNQTADERKERETIRAELQKLRDEDLKGIKKQLRDERKAREASDRENQTLHDEIREMKTQLEKQLKDMTLPLHVLPCSPYDDKLKKSFIHQLSLHVDINRELSPTVSPPIIVIFQPQGRPSDEFDGVVQNFLVIGNSNCKNIILFTAFATSQRYGRGFTPDCVSRFQYTDKLFITSGHLDTQVNKSTFERLGAILVNEYEFKVTDDQSQLGTSTGSDANSHVDRNYSTRRCAGGKVDRDHSTVSKANSQGERGHSKGRDADGHVDNALSSRKDVKAGKAHFTVSDATGQLDKVSSDPNSETGIICNLGDINRLRMILQEMERGTTDLQGKVEKRLASQPLILLRIFEAMMEYLFQRQEAADTWEMRGRSQALSGDDMASTVKDQLVIEKGSLNKESRHNPCVHSGTGCGQNVDGIDRLRMIKDEMKTKTTDLQLRVETKLKLPVGILPRILDKVLIHLEQEREAAELRERSPLLLGDDVTNKIEERLKLDKGSVNKTISSLLEVRQEGKYTLKRAGKWLMNSIFGKS